MSVMGPRLILKVAEPQTENCPVIWYQSTVGKPLPPAHMSQRDHSHRGMGQMGTHIHNKGPSQLTLSLFC